MSKLELSCSIYTFEDLIKGNFLYVDKTDYLWNLVRPYKAMVFLARPRRFGKSLAVSTLKAIFQGKKELFKGLAIYDKPYDWKSYPVIHLDHANCSARTPQELLDYLHNAIENVAYSFQLKLRGGTLSTDFEFLIEDLSRTAPVVILVDEYDKPILNNVTKPEVREILGVLKGFYSTIKKCEGKIRFVFVTGVTKFCHVSIFSDLNNLMDLTMNADYATMLGYTQREFEANFSEWIAETEAKQELPHDDYLNEIKNWYDGYRFHANAETVYNPVSLASFFSHKGEFNNYWFTTGTTSFLFNLMKKNAVKLQEMLEKSVSASFFEAFEIDDLNAKTLLFQTGYLTIKKCVQVPVPYTRVKNKEYILDFPNYEVKSSFNEHLLKYYTNIPTDQCPGLIRELIQSVGSGDVDGFVKRLRIIFANIPYDMRGTAEQDYQTIIYVIFMLLNIYIEAEHRTNDGRIDLMLSVGEWIYIIELKLNHSAAEAMKQIENKEYALSFQGRGKRIMAIGLNFDTEHGQIMDFLKEEVSSKLLSALA